MKHLDPNDFGEAKGHPLWPTVKQGGALSGDEQDNNGKAELIGADVRLSFKDIHHDLDSPEDSCYGCSVPHPCWCFCYAADRRTGAAVFMWAASALPCAG